ncbi:MAG: ATP/GTP-binding protein [Gemmatimonadaceae bacterium]|nr:ATP/GTP-binding protein [Chitinophagaceae bacterium]
MKKIWLLAFILSAFLINADAQHKLVKLWESDTTLKVPESVLYDAGDKILYVTNIDGQPWDADGKGSLAKVGLDGKIINAEWITGMHAPKGIGRYKNKLYIGDVTEVVVIDISAGKIEKKIAVPGSSGLNDVSVDPSGVVYVSDSRAKKVFRLDNEVPTLVIDSTNGLKGPNGVLIHNGELFVLDAGAMYSVGADKVLKKIAEGMDGGTDGIENVKGKEFIVSCWAGQLFYINADGTKETLLDTRQQKINTADIGYDAKNRILYVPTFWKNNIVAYRVD